MAALTVTDTTFTPDSDGVLVVSITFDSQITSGANWGASAKSRPFCTQSGTTQYGDSIPMSTTRLSQGLRGVFNVVGGVVCTIGLDGLFSLASAGWWNIHITAELIKR